MHTEEEERLWQQYRRTGAEAAYRNLVEFYLPLVAQVTERLSIRIRQEIEREELLSVGVVGLHHAVQRYRREDARGGFQAFARKRIRGSILDELRRRDHLSRGQRRAYRRICTLIREFVEGEGRMPTDDELAQRVGQGIDQIRRLIDLAGRSVSLDAELRDGGVRADLMPDNSAVLPSDAADVALSREAFRGAYRRLSEREQKLLFLRHKEGMRVKEVARILEISEGRVSQMHKEIVTKIRSMLNVDGKPQQSPEVPNHATG